MLASDVAEELGPLAEGSDNLDQLAGAGAAVAPRGVLCSRPRRSTAALMLDVAQARLAERCGR